MDDRIKAPWQPKTVKDATRAPTATDDDTKWFSRHSTWVNINTGNFWTCLDATPGRAVWGKMTTGVNAFDAENTGAGVELFKDTDDDRLRFKTLKSNTLDITSSDGMVSLEVKETDDTYIKALESDTLDITNNDGTVSLEVKETTDTRTYKTNTFTEGVDTVQLQKEIQASNIEGVVLGVRNLDPDVIIAFMTELTSDDAEILDGLVSTHVPGSGEQLQILNLRPEPQMITSTRHTRIALIKFPGTTKAFITVRGFRYSSAKNYVVRIWDSTNRKTIANQAFTNEKEAETMFVTVRNLSPEAAMWSISARVTSNNSKEPMASVSSIVVEYA